MVAYIALFIRCYPDLFFSYIWLQSVEHGLTRTEQRRGYAGNALLQITGTPGAPAVDAVGTTPRARQPTQKSSVRVRAFLPGVFGRISIAHSYFHESQFTSCFVIDSGPSRGLRRWRR
ncbi:hypothetical protein BCAR13_1360043 [Paraburkholderia caribensis]|nr:hypothetical protein BCAR13_1360043 [Paraburkholderia caribensis]